MPSHKQINVESTFNAFVKSFGGELVAEMVGRSPKFANADYLFHEADVVIELKCLQKDILEEYQVDVEKLFENWIQRGLVSDPGCGPFRLRTKTLPRECQREFFGLIRKPIHGAVEKANKQIRETKDHLHLPSAKGVLLFANDGCWSLESESVVYSIDKSLGDRFRNINSLVYFTPNMPARLPGIGQMVLVWLQGVRKGMDAVDATFLTGLGRGWMSFHSQLIGEQLPEILVEEHKRLSEARFVK